MKSDDLYEVLGVSRTSTKEDIKKAYRKLARELHPDKNKDNKIAEERFKKVSAAYTVLGDAEKRKMYDQYGIDGLRDGFDPNMWNQYGGFRPGQGSTQTTGFDFGGANADFGGFQGFGAMEDIFESLFGGKSGRGRRSGGRSTGNWKAAGEKGAQVKSILEVELLDAVLGRELEIVIPIENERRNLRVKIPEGIESGKTIRLKQQGAKSPNGGEAGDLLLEIRIKKDRNYDREKLDLTKREKITIKEAYEGVQKEITTPWGPVRMTIPAGTQGGSKMRLKGKGIKQGQEQGDLYVQMVIQIPINQDEKTKKAIDALEDCY